MAMEEIRRKIDQIDDQMKQLIMHRMDQAGLVAEIKVNQGETTIYRADREAEILKRLGNHVSEGRKAEYLAIVRKMMEVCRMYEYDLMSDQIPGVLEAVTEGIAYQETDTHVKVYFKRPDNVNSLSSVLSMIGDYGCQITELCIGDKDENASIGFEVTILACLSECRIQKLMFQLSKETMDFHIVTSFSYKGYNG